MIFFCNKTRGYKYQITVTTIMPFANTTIGCISHNAHFFNISLLPMYAANLFVNITRGREPTIQ